MVDAFERHFHMSANGRLQPNLNSGTSDGVCQIKSELPHIIVEPSGQTAELRSFRNLVGLTIKHSDVARIVASLIDPVLRSIKDATIAFWLLLRIPSSISNELNSRMLMILMNLCLKSNEHRHEIHT